jgi:hypothetical protein
MKDWKNADFRRDYFRQYHKTHRFEMAANQQRYRDRLKSRTNVHVDTASGKK